MTDLNYLSNAIQGAANASVQAGAAADNAILRDKEIKQQAQASQQYNAYLQQQQTNQQKQQQYAQIMGPYQGMLNTAMQTVQAAKQQNATPDQINSALSGVRGILSKYETMATNIGFPLQPGTADVYLNAAISGQGTAQQLAQAKGQAAGTAATAQYQTMAPTFGETTANAAASGVPPQKPFTTVPGYGTLNEQSGQMTPNADYQQQTVAMQKARPTPINGPTWLNESYTGGPMKTQQALADKTSALYETANTYKQLDAILQSKPVDMAAQTKAFVQKWGQSLGIDPHILDNNTLDAYDTAQKVAGKAALSFAQSMKGNFSDKDREFVSTLPPNIYMTPSGRQLLVQMYNVAAQNAERTQMAGAEVIGKYQRMGSPTPPPQDEYDAAINGAQAHPDLLIYDPEAARLAEQGKKEVSALPAALTSDSYSPPAGNTAQQSQTQTQYNTTPSPEAQKAIDAWMKNKQ